MSRRHSAPYVDTRAMPPAQKNQEYIVINGTPRPYKRQISGGEIIEMTKVPPGRRAVKVGDGNVQSIEPYKQYKPRELMDKYGNPVQITTMPDRTKGHAFFDIGALFGDRHSAGTLFPHKHGSIFSGKRSRASK